MTLYEGWHSTISREIVTPLIERSVRQWGHVNDNAPGMATHSATVVQTEDVEG